MTVPGMTVAGMTVPFPGMTVPAVHRSHRPRRQRNRIMSTSPIQGAR